MLCYVEHMYVVLLTLISDQLKVSLTKFISKYLYVDIEEDRKYLRTV